MEVSEKPVHRVNIKNFSMAQTEVANEQFCAFLNAKGNQQDENGTEWLEMNKYVLIEKRNQQFYSKTGFADFPVVKVTWFGAVAYCRWLSEITGDNYRLPSEAEWEYAAGGGSSSRLEWSGTNEKPGLREFGNFAGIKGVDNYKHSAPVGSFKKNSLNLYDMSGNVYEWCQDKWHKNYQARWHRNYEGAPIDGSAWEIGIGNKRVMRGGSWYSPNATYLRVKNRSFGDASYADITVGFRPAKIP